MAIFKSLILNDFYYHADLEMSSDEEDFFVVAEGADSNEDESEILSDSDTYEELEDSYEISSIEDLLELELSLIHI